ncbi:putative tpr [Schistosoma mansoni]|uniref:putative tpr n=1 Tax=Schistosoma mansoni TaxID=6183 RepID=UPI00022DC4BF|nr:putative tpr [Schistosoma mansoni]|eukprot:XP_018651424.1 putative tpr [Schistosoma mansoni]
MAGFESLCSYGGITEEEIGLVEPELVTKLNIAFDNIYHDGEVAKEELAKLQKAQENSALHFSEEQYKLKSASEELEKKLKECNDALYAIEEKLHNVNAEKEDFRTKLSDCLSVNNELNLAIRGLENEKEILSDQLKNKLGLIDSLTSDISELRTEAENVRKLKIEMMLKSEDIIGRESSIKAQEARWSDELSNLQRHNDWLEERLQQTTDQLLTVRRDSYQKSYSLEAELGLRNVELENSKQCIERLETNVKKLTQANDEYIVKLKLVTDEQIKMEQLYGNEIEAQKQLIKLYKEQVKELEEKNEELSNAVSSIQGLLKEAYENVSRLENENSFLQAKCSEANSKLQTATENLASELERSQHLLDKFRVDGLSEEELRQLNPSVAATLSALKRGHSLTQLYADYVQVVEDRDQLKLDKQRLTEYVEQMVDELKEKAPLLRNQQEEYRKLQTELKELTSCYECATKKLEETQLQKRESERRAGFYHRETCRLKQTCSDLSKQVKSLLYEVEVSRGTVIRIPDSSMDITNVSSMLENLASSAMIIDDHLVTWKNLDELQSQNQRLLCVARDLAAQLEKHEQEDSDTIKRISELSSRVETLSGELDVVRLAAREARTEANMFSQQRDQYRALLRKYDIDISDKEELSSAQSQESILDDVNPLSRCMVNNKTPNKGSPPSNGSSAVIERLEGALSSLQAEFARYREDKLESDNVYTTTVDSLRREYNEARLLNQKLSSQLDFTHEKLRASEANVAGYKQEITILREMNARYSTSAASSEAELSRLRDELTHTSDRLTTAEVDARHFSRQLEAMRANETRLKQEIDSLRRHDQIHSQLMHQLQSIQGSLEQRESMDRSSNERKIEQLEKQLSTANSALIDASKASQIAQQTLQHELTLSRESLESSGREIQQLNTRIRDLEERLAAVKPHDGNMEPNLSESSPECSKKAQIRVREMEHEIESLKSSLESSRQQSDRMKTLAEQAEERLKEIVEENKRLEEHFSRDMCETKQHKTKQLLYYIYRLMHQTERPNHNRVNFHLFNYQIEYLRRELASLQNELESSRTRYESALQVEAGAKAEIESHQQAAQEARDKYERELTLHAHDVELLTAVRSQLDSIKMHSSELEQELNESRSKAETAMADLKIQSELWESEKQELNRQLKQGQEEQNLLQDQIIQVKDRMSSTQDIESINSDIKTSEELLQVIGYLRRQKNMADVAHEAASAEVSRLLLRVSSLESQKENLQSQIDNERKAAELAMETARKHSEVMERVEQLNLVTESNRLLRHEREVLRSKLSDAENQLAKLNDEVGPLKQSNSDLIAQKDILIYDKRSLEEERDRWKERCSRLVETAQRMDPEQYRLACNERDELQRRLNRAEEEVQNNANKLCELKNESDDQIKKLNDLLESVRNSYQEAEQKISSFSVQENLLKEDLSAKETTIMKLREIGRKYRQETEVLRRKLNDSRSDEAQLQTTNEALTEAKADLVTLRSDYSSLRTQYDLLEASVTEALQFLDEVKARESVITIMNSSVEGSDIEINSNMSNGQKVVNEFRRLLSGLCNEIDRLQQHSDSQKERLLRTQLIESQLTKSQKDCTELRARLIELQSNSVHPQTVSVSLQTSGAPSPATSNLQESESQDGVQITHTFVPRTLALGASPTNQITGNQLHFETPTCLNVTDGSSTETTSSVVSQSIPAWIMRAGATVQPVHPTPAITPPNSLAGPKQTAEIRPITSNVAAVMPTPAPSVPMLITSGQSENVPICGPSSIAICSPVSDTTVGLSASLFTSCDQNATSLLRNTFLRRGNILNQPQSNILTPVSSHPTYPACSSNVPTSAPRSTTVSITGKRRFEESCPNSNVDSMLHIIPPVDDNMVSTSEVSRNSENSFLSAINTNNFHQQQFTPSSIPSESKRIRQAMVSGPSTSVSFTQASPSPIVLGRSPFGISVPATTPLHATASRLVAGQQEPSSSTLGTLTVATGVAGIITPGTFETSESVEQSSNEAGVEMEQTTASDTVTRRELDENARGEIDIPAMDCHTENIEVGESEVRTSDQHITSPMKPTSSTLEEVCESSDEEQECYSENDAFYDADQRESGSMDDDYVESDSKDSSFDANNNNNIRFSTVPTTSRPSEFVTEDLCKQEVDTVYNESGSDDDTQPRDADGEEHYSSGVDNYGNEETNEHTAPTDVGVPENVGDCYERVGGNDGQLHYETNSTEKSDSTSQISEKAPTSLNTEMEPVSSSKSLLGESSIPSLFSSSGLPKTSGSLLGSSGLFSGFKPSSLTVPYSVATTESGLPSSSCTGLFKSFLPVNTVPSSTTTPLLFKPSTFSASIAASKESQSSGDSSTSRPKIQPIVWDSFDPSTAQSSISDSACTSGPVRRKKWCPVASVPRATRRSSLPTSRGCATGKPGSIRGGLPPRRG